MLRAEAINIIPLCILKIHVRVWCPVHSGLLVQRGNSLSGLDLIQAKCESKTARELLNATDVRRGPVQVGSLVLEQLVEQLQEKMLKRVSAREHSEPEGHIVSTFCVFLLRALLASELTCCRLRMSVLAQRILSICLVLLRVSLMMSP